jgi:invasion protein IalB
MFFRSVLTAALVSIGAPAVAQQGRPAATPAAPPAATAQNQPAAPAPAEARPPQLARQEVSYFDNWQVTCQEFVSPARKSCSALLQLLQTNQQSNTATVVISWLLQQSDGQLTAVIQTPTGVLIAPGVELKAGRSSRKLAFTRCDQQRCEANFQIDEPLSKELSAAENAELTLRSGQNAPAAFTIPMKGFDRAVQALKR